MKIIILKQVSGIISQIRFYVVIIYYIHPEFVHVFSTTELWCSAFPVKIQKTLHTENVQLQFRSCKTLQQTSYQQIELVISSLKAVHLWISLSFSSEENTPCMCFAVRTKEKGLSKFDWIKCQMRRTCTNHCRRFGMRLKHFKGIHSLYLDFLKGAQGPFIS